MSDTLLGASIAIISSVLTTLVGGGVKWFCICAGSLRK